MEHLAEALTVLTCAAVSGGTAWIMSRTAKHGEQLVGHESRLSALERLAERMTDELVLRVRDRERPGP